ncbi:hypothetical protein [Salinibaculum rarum]|uniref:hypothetical protein n=1 Tax=Salinibaculum rarum TaxID=3058903 RepID=UPI00265FA392|nr:hypothetical protein [Salinibaculum sp. KK48]
MAEGERQLDRDADLEEEVDLDIDAVTALDDAPEQTDSAGLGSRLRARVGEFVSGRGLVVSAVLTLASALVVGGFLPFGIVGNLVGIFVAAFAYGTVTSTQRYVELTLAGGALGAGLTLLGNLALSLLGAGVPLVAVGFAAGALAGGLGHYFGRDLRDGLTRDL